MGIGIRSIDAKTTQTTNPIVNMTKTIGLWFMLSKRFPPFSQTNDLKCTVEDCKLAVG